MESLPNMSAGEFLVATYLRGPSSWDEDSQSIILLPPGTKSDRLTDTECMLGPFCQDQLPTQNDPGEGGTDGKIWLQDTRHWAPQHIDFSNGSLTLNLLMADGRVKTVRDINGDGFLNPGFPIKGQSPATVELQPFIVFSGELIKAPTDTQFFENE